MVKNIVIVLLLAIIIGGAVYIQGIQSAAQTPPTAGVEQSSAADTASAPAQQPSAKRPLDYELVAALVASMDKQRRDSFLADQESFSKLVNQEAQRRSLLDAAKASNFANNETIRFLRDRQSDNFLVTSYINTRLQVAGVPEGFPSEEQVQQFYNQNQQSFQLGERLPVWQIFWPVAENASEKDQARILKEASVVSSQLRKGTLTFAEAALRYSEHAASSLNGGFMGILQTADLKPDIKQQILTLKEGTVSKPVRGQNGIHLFMRGALLSSRVLPLDQVRPQVVKLLVQALRQRQQEQLNELAKTEYPQPEIGVQQIAEWYQKIASFYK